MKAVDIRKRYGDVEPLRGVSFVFPMGATAVTGPSGCGKTTLLRVIAGLETPDSGYVEGAGRVSFIFQEDRLINHLSVVKNLRLVCRDEGTIRRALMAADLTDAADKRAYLLSGGMRRRVAVLRGALYEADTLLMDEPFTGVDGQRRDALAGWILERWQGRRIIVVSHEEEDITRLGVTARLELGKE